MNASTKAKAAAFHQLHHADQILILPNCWDALSAVVLKEAGGESDRNDQCGARLGPWIRRWREVAGKQAYPRGPRDHPDHRSSGDGRSRKWI
jgi:hypothetical protein